jgi:crotonobetainyl-CoA:carnitine CoA-transferase CaiB-like acyl-CoA transferase
MVVEVEHTSLGRGRSIGSPVKLSDRAAELRGRSASSGSEEDGVGPTTKRRGAPLLGEHTREVLAEAGYATDQVDGFVAEGSVLQHAETTER